MNASSGMAPGGGTWSWLWDDAGYTVSLLYEIPWMLRAALAKPKETAE